MKSTTRTAPTPPRRIDLAGLAGETVAPASGYLDRLLMGTGPERVNAGIDTQVCDASAPALRVLETGFGGGDLLFRERAEQFKRYPAVFGESRRRAMWGLRFYRCKRSGNAKLNYI